MRGRKKEPEGKRVTFSFKVSEAEAAAIEAARDGMDRSEWLRLAALTAAGRKPARRVQRVKAAAPAPVAPAPMTVPFREPAAEPDCPHPKTARLKGRCTRCRTFVGYN